MISAGSTFVENIASAAAGQNARKSGVEAAEAATRHLKLKASKPFEVLQRRGGPNEQLTLSDGGIAAKPIDAKLIWLPRGDGQVRLAWRLEIDQDDGAHWVYAFVDAETGESLGEHDLIVHDSAALDRRGYRASGRHGMPPSPPSRPPTAQPIACIRSLSRARRDGDRSAGLERG